MRQAVHDARRAVEEITVPPSAGRSEPATKTVVQAIAVAQALRSRVAHRLHYIASQTGIVDAEAESPSAIRCAHRLNQLIFCICSIALGWVRHVQVYMEWHICCTALPARRKASMRMQTQAAPGSSRATGVCSLCASAFELQLW